MLAASADLFGLSAGRLPSSGEVALRRAVRRRHRMTAEAHNAEVRLWSLAAWAHPRPVESKWVDPTVFPERCWDAGLVSTSLGRAHISSLAPLCRSCLREVGDPEQRAGRIRETARGWARFWAGRLDLDVLAWEITELIDDIDVC